MPTYAGYLRPLYLLPLFQKRIAFGGYPFNLSDVQYPKGLCPVSEDASARTMAIPFHGRLERDDQERVARALRSALASA